MGMAEEKGREAKEVREVRVVARDGLHVGDVTAAVYHDHHLYTGGDDGRIKVGIYFKTLSSTN